MDSLKIAAWLAMAALMCGCMSQTQIREKYVCSDGWVSDAPADCVGRAPPGYNTTCKKTACPECKCAQTTQEAPTNQSAPANQTVSANTSTKAVSVAAQSSDPCAALGCPAGTQYVSSNSSTKYHTCECRFAKTLSKKKLMCFKDAQEAQAAGKEQCGICAKT